MKEFDMFISKIREKKLNVDEVLVYDNGKILRENLSGYEGLHPIYSVSKFITGLCVMKAIELKLLNTEMPVMDFFKDIEIYNKENLTYLKDLKIKHLLTLTIGQEKQITYSSWLKEKTRNESHLSYILNYPIKHKAGSFFFYSNANNYLLAAILQKITNKTLLQFAQEYIFLPLGISDSYWEKCDNGICLGGTGVFITINDLLKIALMLMNDGKYENKQIIDETIIKNMKAEKLSRDEVNYHYISPVFPKWAYGYNIWLTNDGNYFADSKLGQFMIILPKKKRIILTLSSEKQMREIVNCMEDLK